MKYKIITIAVVISMVVGTFFLQGYEGPKNRYHQHLQAKTKEKCTDHDEDVFCTHLPLLNITTDGEIPEPHILNEDGTIKKDENGKSEKNNETVASTITLYDSKNKNNHLNDKPVFTEKAQFRIRGNSSRRFEKKGYAINFKEDDLITNKAVEFAGMTADNNWALHGPFLDRTLIRNYLAYNIVGEIMDYSPNVRFCEMFLNGEYQGLYLITEKISFNKNGRVKLTPTDSKNLDTSYILKLDSGALDPARNLTTFADNTGKRGSNKRKYEKLEILYPNETLTKDQHDSIQNNISHFEKSLTSFDSTDPNRGYPSYIDVQSFVDYYVLNEFMMNADAGRISTYYSKDIRGKIKIIGWDYNSIFNNYFMDLTQPQEFYTTNLWMNFLLKDVKFVNKVNTTYHKLRFYNFLMMLRLIDHLSDQ